MIQNLLILKKGISGFFYVQVKIESEDVEESTVTTTEVDE